MSDAPSISPIDYASSPTLSTIRDIAGEEVVMRLVLLFGGTWVHIPHRMKPDSQLVRAVGAQAAAAIADHFHGGSALKIPCGTGHGHGRRIDWDEVMRLSAEGWSLPRLAAHFKCSDRQILKIRAARRPLPQRCV